MRTLTVFALLAVTVLSIPAQERSVTDDQPSTTVPQASMIQFPPGVSFTALLKSDLWSVVHGGLAPVSEFIGNADLILSVDLETAAGLNGSSFLLQFLANNGGGVNHGIGESQMVTNIEGYRTMRLYQCWVNKEFSDAGIAVLAGLFDLNSEFYVTPTSGIFLNASHGIGIDLSQTGTNGPSIFPSTSLAARVRFDLAGNVSSAVAVFDAAPGDPLDGAQFDATIRSGDGFLIISESEYRFAADQKISAGVWYYTSAYASICGAHGLEEYRELRENAGIYLLADVSPFTEEEDVLHGLSLFARVGMANAELNAVGTFFGGGLVYTGLFDIRPADKFGYALALASYGNDYLSVCRSMGDAVTGTELVHELTYRAPLSSFLTVQADVQYVVHPSASLNINSAFAAGFRIEAGL
ncbi:MAG: carbohydrate porin [Bacteroidetes bacterium]|nr:carbohydrate porin [Bacteroidota bacterium]